MCLARTRTCARSVLDSLLVEGLRELVLWNGLKGITNVLLFITCTNESMATTDNTGEEPSVVDTKALHGRMARPQKAGP
jgi:hypothetical protein